jgi:hypothetical protein
LYSFALFVLTHYQLRYRVPLVIFLIPYAAFALVQFGSWLRKPGLQIQRPVRASAAVLVLILCLVIIPL